MKKITLLCIALLAVQTAYSLEDLDSTLSFSGRQKRNPNIKSFNLSQEHLAKDLGPISKAKTINLTIPQATGNKHASYIQFRPTQANLSEGNVARVLVCTEYLTQKKAVRHNLDWVKGKQQVLVKVFSSQDLPTSEKTMMNKQYQQAFLKSHLNEPLKMSMDKHGKVQVNMHQDGDYKTVSSFTI